MPNFRTEAAVARYAVAPLDSAVNIMERLREISDYAEEVGDRVLAACNMAQGELDVLEQYDLGDEPNDRRDSLAAYLLEIEIAAHDLDELGGLIKKLTY